MEVCLSTHVLVLTDVVDSTKLTEGRGDLEMARIWSAHDRMARDLLREHGGREIDRTDGFLLLFEAVEPALAFAAAYHQALEPLGMVARVGVHRGEVVLIEASPEDVALGAKPVEVEGLAKPLAARVMALAAGGQTLVTAETLDRPEPRPFRVESHGWWRLKGISQPIEIREVGPEGAAFEPPEDHPKAYRVVRDGDLWLPRREIPYSLPAERDAFVGRTADLRALGRLFSGGARLVSVLGIGGTGKTRLVTRFGWQSLGESPGGVWFCDLSDTRGVEGICRALARALDVQLGGGDPVEQVGHAIAGRGACLVILDNFEQVVEHGRATVGRWLDRAVEARFAVTSRERLSISGETVLALAPLPEADALQLFVARAAQADPRFELLPDEHPAALELIALLDALPLAIELAAARIRMMRPPELLRRMGDRFRLLAGSRSRPSRQATLRGALDWSWDLLGEDERSALAQLSVFQGGFTLEAAEAVLELDELWPMDAVQALVDKSLVRVLGGQRMELMVSVHAYAAEKLLDPEPVQVRHGAWFAAMGSPEAVAALARTGGTERRRALTLELDNLAVACRRAVLRGDRAVATGALRACAPVLLVLGPVAELVELAREVVAMPSASAAERLAAEECLVDALLTVGAPEALDRARQRLELARQAGDRGAEARALGAIGRHHLDRGSPAKAEPLLLEALELVRALGDLPGQARTLGMLAFHYDISGHDDLAIAHFEEALRLVRELGDRHAEAAALSNFGMFHMDRERNEEGRALLLEGLAIHRADGNRRNEGVVLGALARVAARSGDPEEAVRTYRQSLALHRQLGQRGNEGTVVTNMGLLLLDLGRVDEALEALRSGLAAHREVGHLRNAWIAATGLARGFKDRDGPAAARPWVEAALGIAEALGDEAKIAECRAALAEGEAQEG